MMTSVREQQQATFASCLKAAHDPAHTLVAHSWALLAPSHNKGSNRASRQAEIAAVLGVMAGDPSARYGIHKPNFPFNAHWLNGSDHGFIGLACSMVGTGNPKYLPDYYAPTGLLLLDAPPIFVAPYDAWTTYYQNSAAIPSDKAWNFITQYGSSIHQIPENHPRLRSLCYFRDHPEQRDRLNAKLCALYIKESHPLNELVLRQGEPEDIAQGFVAVDPLSKAVQSRARACSKELYLRLGSERRETEVDVNAQITHAAGIVVYRNPDQVEITAGPCALLTQIKQEPNFAKTIAQALLEYDLLNKLLKQYGIAREPTIMIYQPHGKEQLLHAAPTIQLRAAVQRLAEVRTEGRMQR